ncbi:MAG TPA: Crp/Fnr family transcriptional regulator [Crenotrichaceae bacterium]|nr:Crp/Fnr family transcriptional regulator [Crenotrichaceae bacterium]
MNENKPLLDGLCADNIDEIKHFGITRTYKKKSIIFFQNDDSNSLYFIEQGQVKIQVLGKTGRTNLLRILGPGEYFGELGLLDEKPRSTTAETLVDSQITVISKTQFITCLTNNPILYSRLISVLTERIRHLTNELTNSRITNSYICFRTKLYELATEQPDGTYILEQSLTQQDLGDFVGTARENINRFVKALKQGGYLTVSTRGKWIIEKPLPHNW